MVQEIAAPALHCVIAVFRNKANNDCTRLLDMHDSQFASVIRTCFQLPLALSGGVPSAYLTFNTDGMAHDQENCAAILVVDLRSLNSCGQRTPAFYRLARSSAPSAAGPTAHGAVPVDTDADLRGSCASGDGVLGAAGGLAA
jgi:hypothetical protein